MITSCFNRKYLMHKDQCGRANKFPILNFFLCQALLNSGYGGRGGLHILILTDGTLFSTKCCKKTAPNTCSLILTKLLLQPICWQSFIQHGISAIFDKTLDLITKDDMNAQRIKHYLQKFKTISMREGKNCSQINKVQ